MGAPDMEIGGGQQVLVVVPPEDVPAPTADAACDLDCHFPHKTAGRGAFFRSGVGFRRVRVGQLEVRRHLLEVPDQLLGRRALQHRE